jgi:hypothetical protein
VKICKKKAEPRIANERQKIGRKRFTALVTVTPMKDNLKKEQTPSEAERQVVKDKTIFKQEKVQFQAV